VAIFNESDVHWMIQNAYGRGLLDGLESAAKVVEAYDIGAKHIVSKIHAEERKKEVAKAIRDLKGEYDGTGLA
jgi:hypothetical protein